MFLPWIGANYEQQSPKTLILGESHYVDAYVRSGKRLEEKTIKNIEDQMVNAWPSPFHTKVAAMLIGHLPSLDEKKQFWNSIAYHNLITEPLSASRIRPTDKQWTTSVATLPIVFNKLKPDYCICLGYRMWGVLRYFLPHTPITVSADIGPRGAVWSESLNCVFHGMMHPSAGGFRREDWHRRITNLRHARWEAGSEASNDQGSQMQR